MTDQELAILAKGIAPIVREQMATFTATLDSLTLRLAALEQREPRDGRDGLPGVPGQMGAQGVTGPEGPAGRDGIDGKDGLDGQQGLPGEPGKDGKDADESRVAALEVGIRELQAELLQVKSSLTVDQVTPLVALEVAKAVAALPVPKDGRDGIDGKDGRDGIDLNLEDLTVLYDGERTVTLQFARGEIVKEWAIKFPVPIYKGVYGQDGRIAFEQADIVTHGGSMWIAKEDTSVNPSEHVPDGKRAWTLSCKRGKEGKPGVNGRDLRPSEPVKVK